MSIAADMFDVDMARALAAESSLAMMHACVGAVVAYHPKSLPAMMTAAYYVGKVAGCVVNKADLWEGHDELSRPKWAIFREWCGDDDGLVSSSVFAYAHHDYAALLAPLLSNAESSWVFAQLVVRTVVFLVDLQSAEDSLGSRARNLVQPLVAEFLGHLPPWMCVMPRLSVNVVALLVDRVMQDSELDLVPLCLQRAYDWCLHQMVHALESRMVCDPFLVSCCLYVVRVVWCGTLKKGRCVVTGQRGGVVRAHAEISQAFCDMHACLL